MEPISKNNIYLQFTHFIQKHFELPEKCKNVHQIQFYVHELNALIDRYRSRFNFVPSPAYALLLEYTVLYRAMTHKEHLLHL